MGYAEAGESGRSVKPLLMLSQFESDCPNQEICQSGLLRWFAKPLCRKLHHRFESCYFRQAPLAQLVEQRTFNPWVVSSSLTGSTML
jgi:hypothetical protein